MLLVYMVEGDGLIRDDLEERDLRRRCLEYYPRCATDGHRPKLLYRSSWKPSCCGEMSLRWKSCDECGDWDEGREDRDWVNDRRDLGEEGSSDWLESCSLELSRD